LAFNVSSDEITTAASVGDGWRMPVALITHKAVRRGVRGDYGRDRGQMIASTPTRVQVLRDVAERWFR
jgi:hypothetical protein